MSSGQQPQHRQPCNDARSELYCVGESQILPKPSCRCTAMPCAIGTLGVGAHSCSSAGPK